MLTHTKGVNTYQVPRKDIHFQSQFIATYEGFYKRPQTMKELAEITGIDRANICRYCRTMRKSGMIAVFKKAYCSITKHLANKYTTNPDLFPVNAQLSLFEAEEGQRA